ncbi:folate receptor gamma-like [Cimex lectularius]|uniref:Folate receptor-like domain-containing protein n=1 Tax=Cimex lectularius TaxID=79782 RepID=A0A8I6SEZ7_CIMLE|nr:folate receptor gamma-like [Cimex lectularius]
MVKVQINVPLLCSPSENQLLIILRARNNMMISKLVAIAVLTVLKVDHAVGEQINQCLSSNAHQRIPLPNEGEMFECEPWRNLSCCTEERAKQIHTDDVHKLEQNLCKKPMSSSCKEFFKKETCFFECSPDLKLWFIPLNESESYQRFKNVPLCKSECDDWFNACSDDYTCSDNWYHNINTVTKNCSKSHKNECATIKDKFKTAKQFCEMVWDHSYKVVDDEEHCMKLSLSNETRIPNDEVVQFYLQKDRTNPNTASSVRNSVIFIAIISFIIKCII